MVSVTVQGAVGGVDCALAEIQYPSVGTELFAARDYIRGRRLSPSPVLAEGGRPHTMFIQRRLVNLQNGSGVCPQGRARLR